MPIDCPSQILIKMIVFLHLPIRKSDDDDDDEEDEDDDDHHEPLMRRPTSSYEYSISGCSALLLRFHSVLSLKLNLTPHV